MHADLVTTIDLAQHHARCVAESRVQTLAHVFLCHLVAGTRHGGGTLRQGIAYGQIDDAVSRVVQLSGHELPGLTDELQV